MPTPVRMVFYKMAYRIGIFLLLLTATSSGHVVNQMLMSLEKSGRVWAVVVSFDAAYALAEYRNDVAMPQPQRQWLIGMTAEQHARLRKEAEAYVRDSIRFSCGGAALAYDVEFPDYLSDPPDFPRLLNGGAYFRVRLRGEIPEDLLGEFKLHVSTGDRPDFILASESESEGELGYLVISPGESGLIFTLTSAGGVRKPELGVISLFLLGYSHVLPDGLDHVLFILALFLMMRKWRPLLKQSLVFTLAHSLTLGLAVSGAFQIRQWPLAWLIEPLIALSIVIVALENVFRKEASGYRLGIIFIFGLIHGLGFAGSLGASLQSEGGWVLPLVMANLGVEFAQVTVLVIAWLVTIPLWRSSRYRYASNAASTLIAIIALWWTVTRLFT